MKREDIDKELKTEMGTYEYIIVYEYEKPILHSIYVQHYDEKEKVLELINSRGPIDQFPKVALVDVCPEDGRCLLFRVHCSAHDARQNKGGKIVDIAIKNT